MESIGKKLVIILVMAAANMVFGGPYNESGVAGYVGPDWQATDPADPNAVLNPIFSGWATEVLSYEPSPTVGPDWDDPWYALGPVTGDHIDVVSLGDLSLNMILAGARSGRIVLGFGRAISDGPGYEFAVFENGLEAGGLFGELAYVEVSSDAAAWARFAGVSLTAAPVGAYGTIDSTDVYNLAGKHPNGYGKCVGTPFDLSEVRGEPNVVTGLVDLNNVNYVRIVDIPGSGHYLDAAKGHVDPCTWPTWGHYGGDRPIYDAWETYDSSGFDVEAVGLLYEQQLRGDVNMDGVVDWEDLRMLSSAWQSHFGQQRWRRRCDISEPGDLVVDLRDFAVLARDWKRKELWREQK